VSDPAYFRDCEQHAADPLPSHGVDIVHVWKIDLGRSDWRCCLAALSIDERDRAGRFLFEQDRQRFVVARAALRSLIGWHVQMPASRIHLTVQSHGKPRLVADGHEDKVRFNVSHSYDLALIAISGEREVGVDVERIRPLADLDSIAARHFAPEERQALFRATPVDRLPLFYRYWTLKEAYLKARGFGLHMPLDAVDVSAAAEDPFVLQGGWSARTLTCEPGYAAALVVAGRSGYSVAISTGPLTRTDTPPTVDTSISANG
jgi:4'-phosphopantetheinyl transferase